MIQIAHISDIHFGRTDGIVVAGLLETLRERKPHCIVVSGDLTQRAKTTEYRQAADFLEQLPAPYIVIPGNHDISATKLFERFFLPWRKWRRHIPAPRESLLEMQGATIVGINTVRLKDFSFDWSRGAISGSQVQRVQKDFARCDAGHLKILVAHHPFWLPERFARRHVIYGRNKALDSFRVYGPDIILSGHVHVPFVRILAGKIISHAGTATSTRLVEDNSNSFNLITGDSKRLEIRPFVWGGSRFHSSTANHFQKRDGDWFGV